VYCHLGDDLPELVSPPIGRLNIAFMAVAMRDPNLVHVEDSYAAKSGLPSVIAHGTFVTSYAGAAITRVFGGEALQRLRIHITAPVFPGDSLRVRGTVSATDDSGTRSTIDVRIVNQDDHEVGRGDAMVDTSSAAV
jgi:acyl dehydratase